MEERLDYESLLDSRHRQRRQAVSNLIHRLAVISFFTLLVLFFLIMMGLLIYLMRGFHAT